MPPEVILDRWLKERRMRQERAFSGYLGKLDIEQVESPSFKSFLYRVQDRINEALRLEGPNASGGVEHPPFHFDYFDVESGIKNAHAFQYEGFSFVVITLPMVELIFLVSEYLSRAPRVLELFHISSEGVDLDSVHGLVFEIQLLFLVSHEYTHHVHGHCVENNANAFKVWSEFPDDSACGGVNSQAQELDADGYATYLVLAHLLRGEGRQSAAQQLSRTDLPGTEGDELLLTCFLLAALAYFCSFWHGGTKTASLYRSTHPPPPIRIKYLIQVAEMWCCQNGSVPKPWFAPARLQTLFSTAAEAIGESARRTWDADIAALHSTGGRQYEMHLFERFEAVRKGS